MFRWLIYKYLMVCSYRDLESMSGIDYSTFIKFRKRLIKNSWFSVIFKNLACWAAQQAKSLNLVLDSSFVQTYSKRKEFGSEYSGYKKKIGFKLHQIIDFKSRLPLIQFTSPGARADVVWGTHLLRASPKYWDVKSFMPDKAYDSELFVNEIIQKWPGTKVAIPVRRTNQRISWQEQKSGYNYYLKSLQRCLSSALFKKRSEIERYFSRKKSVFNLGEEKTRGIINFQANCHMTSIMEILEYMAKIIQSFTKLQF